MAVFWIGSGDPFHYDMDETPFYDAVRDLSSDVFHFAADTRLSSQSTMYDALTYRNREVIRWLKVGDNPMPSAEEWATFGLVVYFVAITTILPYTNPWTAGPAFALDAYNIYRYFD